MTDRQAERIRGLWSSGRTGTSMSLSEVPAGSIVAWGPNWIEVIEPTPTGALSWDMGGAVVERYTSCSAMTEEQP